MDDVVVDADVDLTPFLLHDLQYGGFVPGEEDWEWHPDTISARIMIERALEAQLHRTVSQPVCPCAERGAVARALFISTVAHPGLNLAQYLARTATRKQTIEFIVHRSVYSP
ncbi:hypothetical protein E3O44_11980 [Cryobacterium algoricola]|uniref:Uncharacterized protein n=1 Tax=Cryobacterium algoricola TaxID=1259183 RepID=A0ABY2IDN2_9MICO|nr:hypothetical protein [Cryobacterium algoricola]TFB86319.1 hypothetical protein E3O44_11980 [Cryobacterium algoricola]